MRVETGVTTASLRALVVGAGVAGRRFLDVLAHLQQNGDLPLRAIAVCDSDPNQFVGLVPTSQTFIRTDQALRDFRPDAVIVAVNEASHLDVYREIARCRSVRGILTEKPLTGSLRDSLEAIELLRGRCFSMNFVERFSPIVTQFAEWRAAHPSYAPVRVHARWGKNRIGDPRPTIGVMSEVVHPLDLADWLVGLEDVHVEHIRGMVSDYSVSGASVAETVDVLLRTPRCAVSVNCSFAWTERTRLIEIILRGPRRELVAATLCFDTPKWDCDQLTIRRLDSIKGDWEVIERHACTNHDFAAALTQRYKVSEFVRAGLRELVDGERDARLPTLGDVARMERLIEDLRIRSAASGNSFTVRIHGADTPPAPQGHHSASAARAAHMTRLTLDDVEARL